MMTRTASVALFARAAVLVPSDQLNRQIQRKNDADSP